MKAVLTVCVLLVAGLSVCGNGDAGFGTLVFIAQPAEEIGQGAKAMLSDKLYERFGTPDYAVAHFAQQIAAIEAGLQPPILETGNLDSWRDLSDVRDTVQAYLLLMERGRAGEAYNIGSGTAQSMRAVLEKLLARTSQPIEVRPLVEIRRGAAPVRLRADVAKLQGETGWRPRRSLDDSLADILEYWRDRTRGLTTAQGRITQECRITNA